MELLSPTPVLKPSLDVIRGIIGFLHDKRGEKRDFWLNIVLEPLHSAMGAVHETYIKNIKTFDEAFQRLLKDDASLTELLEFLRDRHRETLSIRDNLQAFGMPPALWTGIHPLFVIIFRQCESYFGDATVQGVSTPLRNC